ncbi:MAG: hypothetical protein U0531_06565 [Dehalococcoidia bacterium]
MLDAMRTGKWDIVEQQLTAYAGAVQAEERHRVVGEALEALEECGGEEGDRPCVTAWQRSNGCGERASRRPIPAPAPPWSPVP